ncbi:hypothetical protein KCP70_13015 [Salmonella enterica subsp. enterica]|nr:hypothetical protein KCP70_13015 [Salmonella enterica subsp. enterica]
MIPPWQSTTSALSQKPSPAATLTIIRNWSSFLPMMPVGLANRSKAR